MKKILLICTLLALLTGCTAPKVYKKNRFTKQFQEPELMYKIYDFVSNNIFRINDKIIGV